MSTDKESTDDWIPIFGDVKVKPSSIPEVDPEKLMEQVLTDALESQFADRINPLSFRPDGNLVTVGTVLALCLALRGANNG